MRIRAAVLMCTALLVCGTSLSQNRLNEVAGSIKLNPEAIVQKDGYVDDEQAAKKADHELFSASLAACSAIADSIGDLVDEARATVMYNDNVLPNRLTAASLDLDTQVQELYLLRLTEAFVQPVSTAREAAEVCSSATASVREELARRGVAFLQAKEEITRCRQGLDRAESEVEAVIGRPGDVAPAAEVAPAVLSDDEIIAAVCGQGGQKGQEAYDACEGRQYRSLAALSSRTADNEMLDPAIFDGIREICAELHRGDFDLRNRCELDKMTASRLEGE